MKFFAYGLLLLLSACVSTSALQIQSASRVNTELGVAYLNEHQYARALNKLHLAITQDAKNVDAWFALGDIELLLHHDAKALSALETALNLDPSRLDIQNNIGVLDCRMGRVAEGRVIFEALAKDPRYFDQEGAEENARRCAA